MDNESAALTKNNLNQVRNACCPYINIGESPIIVGSKLYATCLDQDRLPVFKEIK